MTRSRNLKNKMNKRKVRLTTISVCRPSCMDVAKQIQIGILKEEVNNERNKNRKKKA